MSNQNLVNDILDQKIKEIDSEIKSLNMKKLHLLSKKEYYKLDLTNFELNKPFIQTEKTMHAILEPMTIINELSLQGNIDFCFINCINRFSTMCEFPYVGIGMKLGLDAILNNEPQCDLNVVILVDSCCHQDPNITLIEGGEYLCMYKYSTSDDFYHLYENKFWLQ